MGVNYKDKYNNYLHSSDWLLKKSKFIIYTKKELGIIDCLRCRSTDNLEVHHITYKNIFNEDIKKDLMLLCRTCHQHRHDNQHEDCLSFFTCNECKYIIEKCKCKSNI